MSTHSPAFWHRFLSVRWLIPLLIFIAAICFGLYALKSDVAQGRLHTEQQAVAEMTLQMTHLQGTLEYLMQSQQLEAVHEEVAALGSNSALQQGLLIDERQHVVASIRRAQLGLPVQRAWPELARSEHTLPMRRARERMAGSVQVSENGMQVVGYYPITLQSGARHERVGMLVLQQDLTANKLTRQVEAERWAARSLLVVLGLACIVGLVVHFVLGRRIQRLVSTAYRLAQGELSARADLKGVDEVGLLGRAFDDMAERMDRSNKQLQESQERIRALLDSTAEAIFGLDLEGRCTFCNRAALRLSGHEHAEALLGRPLHSIIHPGTGESDSCRVCQSFLEEDALHGDDESIHRDQGDVPVEYWSHPVSRCGERVGSVVTFVDIGERKRAESARRRMEEGFRALIEHSPDAIFLHRAGTLLFANRAAALLLGHDSPEPLRGLPVSELVMPGDEGALTLTSHGGMAREARFRHHDGRLTVGEVMTVSLVFEGLPTVASITRDITERRQVQERMLATERMVSLGTLAAGVAHEINNPLAYMLSNLHFVDTEVRLMAPSVEALGGEQGRELQQALREAIDGGNRVRDIVRDLKTFSRGGGEDQRSSVDIHAVLDSCANMARSEIRHRARLVKAYGSVPPVYANDSRLGQLFLNLLVNAAQAIPHGNANLNEIRVTTTLDDEGQVLVEIRDTGVGIPPENLTRLFDPFFTTKPVGVGTGLGLSICHGIVTAQGGRISVESQPNQGSTFRVQLPALRAPVECLVRPEAELAVG
jgi:two-component system, NtrC family, sensor kinase